MATHKSKNNTENPTHMKHLNRVIKDTYIFVIDYTSSSKSKQFVGVGGQSTRKSCRSTPQCTFLEV